MPFITVLQTPHICTSSKKYYHNQMSAVHNIALYKNPKVFLTIKYIIYFCTIDFNPMLGKGSTSTVNC